MVVGDEKSQVGVGYGKANEVPVAIQKGVERARKNLFKVPMHGSTITHEVDRRPRRRAGAAEAGLQGTGVIAGGGVRAVLELAGIHDVLSKSLGSQNPINLVKATVDGARSAAQPRAGGRAARPDRARGARARRAEGAAEAAPAADGARAAESRSAARRGRPARRRGGARA